MVCGASPLHTTSACRQAQGGYLFNDVSNTSDLLAGDESRCQMANSWTVSIDWRTDPRVIAALRGNEILLGA
jgi:hypothetical protein